MDDSQANIPEDVMIFDGGLESIDINLQDVHDQITCLDTSKSYGPDNISPKFLKEGSIVLEELLLRLYRISLQLQKVPRI